MIVERAVRRVTERTSAVLLQSGLGNEWWADSMVCYCYLRNIQDLLSDGKTPYESRFWKPLNRPVVPFGAMVELPPNLCERPIEITSIWPKSLARYIPLICTVRGVNLESRHSSSRHLRVGADGRI